jgi:hypothetical protein
MSSWIAKGKRRPNVKKVLKAERLISYNNEIQKLPERVRAYCWEADDGQYYWKIVTVKGKIEVCHGGPFQRKSRMIIAIKKLVEAIRLHEFNLIELTDEDPKHTDDI